MQDQIFSVILKKALFIFRMYKERHQRWPHRYVIQISVGCGVQRIPVHTTRYAIGWSDAR
jgi:hypothetical protein